NFVCGVWFGNDDYSPLNRMTGGSLPAMTWHEIMEYAHQGIELKNLPGLPPNPAPIAPVADSGNKSEPHPPMLTFRGAEVLVRVGVEKRVEEAIRRPGPASAGAQPPAPARAGTIAEAESRRSVRGN